MEWSRLFIVGSVIVCVHIETACFHWLHENIFYTPPPEEKNKPKPWLKNSPLALLTFASVHLLSLTLVLISINSILDSEALFTVFRTANKPGS